MMIKLFIFLGLLDGTLLTQAPTRPCEDIDSQSCKRLHAAKPDLCNDRTFYDSVCKRFCGNCPLQCYSCQQAVLNPSDCTKTETCGINTMCATKTLRAKDGHHEYLMKCEDKEMCDLITGGFGKRDIEDIGISSRRDHAMTEREVTLDCCDRDLCNDGVQTTTTKMTTSTRPKPTTTHAGTTSPHKLTTRPPTQPPPCVDKIDNCAEYGTGLCTKPEYHDWIEMNCRAFCREQLCTPEQIRAHENTTTTTIAPERTSTQIPPCVDKKHNCVDYGKDLCTKPNYHAWIGVNCRAFCREQFCTPEQIRAYKNTTTTIAPERRTTIAPEQCFDHVDCRLYGDGKSQCGSEFSDWAHKNCPLSCGFCIGTTTPPQLCVDKVPNCDEYVNTMCNDPAYKIWREDHCKKFCGLC